MTKLTREELEALSAEGVLVIEGPEEDDQMADAMRRQREQARKSSRVDRKEWTDTQWVKDAHELMHDPDGAVTSLANGHIHAMLRVIATQEDAILRIIQALHDGAETLASRSYRGSVRPR